MSLPPGTRRAGGGAEALDIPRNLSCTEPSWRAPRGRGHSAWL